MQVMGESTPTRANAKRETTRALRPQGSKAKVRWLKEKAEGKGQRLDG